MRIGSRAEAARPPVLERVFRTTRGGPMDIRTTMLRRTPVGWPPAWGGLCLSWPAGPLPYSPPVGGDLVSLSGWGVVGLVAVAALVGLLSGVRALPLAARWVVAG